MNTRLFLSISLFVLFTFACSKKSNTNNEIVNSEIDNPNVFTTEIGNAKIHLLSEMQQPGSLDILIGATPEIIEECAPDSTYPSAINAFLIQTSGKNILVDTGLGILLSENLQSLGVSVDSITDILLTHMHGDHIGGLLKEGNPVFKNARLHILEREYLYWTVDNPTEQVKNIIEAYQKQTNLFNFSLESDESEVLPGITPIPVFGHTPGHTAYLCEFGNESMLIWGDLTHAMAFQMSYPEIAVIYDFNPEEAVTSRKLLLKEITENNTPVAGMHIAYPGMGQVKKIGDDKYEFHPL